MLTPFALSIESTARGETEGVRLLEVHDHDLLDVQAVDHEVRVRRALDVVAGDVTEERTAYPSNVPPTVFVSVVRVADGEMCASFAA